MSALEVEVWPLNIWPKRLARKGMAEWGATSDFEQHARCHGDERFIQEDLEPKIVNELLDICHSCPVESRCLLWAGAQIRPVGFRVAGGRRWRDWGMLED